MSPRALLFATLVVCACTGKISFPSASDAPGVKPKDPITDPTMMQPQPEAPAVAGITALRRLTRTELDLTLAELTGDTHHTALTLMPGEDMKPFDDDYSKQIASAVWVEAAESLAQQITQDTMADTARKASVLPCTPSSDDDMQCLGEFIQTFGRRALRRPLTAAEVTEFSNLHSLARQRGGFDDSMALAMRRLLLDPEFLFHVEVGTPVAGDLANTFQLTPYELASRLSFFLLGRGPSAALLDLADQGKLDTAAGIREVAAQLVDSAEGRAHVELYHAMWLGYFALPYDSTFNSELTTETNALVDKIVFGDKSDYRQLFLSEQSWVNDDLAQHYGLPVSGQSGFRWVSYGTSGRKGILSHAALLSNGVKQTDTSPTLRGKWIRNRLFCQEIPPPPPNVSADVPPPATDGGVVCKKDRYAAHATSASCSACHAKMDPIGFGLEQYDRTGAYRTTEQDHPECAISGDGAIDGVGSFNGPAGLADLMTQSAGFDDCVVRQLFRYESGRTEKPDDEPLIRDVTKAFVADGRRFDQLLVELVANPTFAQRRLETP
ncbi:MAG: DUF1588 domain-containing protein [Myxococcaceae bacterium]